MTAPPDVRRLDEPLRRPRRAVAVSAVLAAALAVAPATSAAAQTADPRQGLAPGTQSEEQGAAFTDPLRDAETVERGIDLLAERSKPAYTGAAGAFNYDNINSDLAFQGDYAFSGNYRGFGVYDVSDPAAPVLRTTVNCVGGQGDVSVLGDLLFMSVESTSARTDCLAPVAGQPASAIFRGVRIFDISDPLAPRYVHGVQTCRGSHTHTLVQDPDVSGSVFVYNSGTSSIRSSAQLAGCSPTSTTDPATSAYSIDVIEVPLAAPTTASVVNKVRLMSACGSNACPEQPFATLGTARTQPTNPPGTGLPPGGQRVAATSACHDITAYPAIGLAAAACQGDGLLLDIRDARNPARIDNVTDNNFAYWHSATFNDAGTKVVFTDEWGGGVGARCRPGDPENWGADAVFDIVTAADGTRTMEFGSYFSIPNVQSSIETCVAHNGNLVPVPGRDVMVQAFYEGGITLWDFTDSKAPVELGFFDRGPYDASTFHQGGYWSAYWYDGQVYGNEIFLGFDVFGLAPSGLLSEDEIGAARLATTGELNAQAQEPIVHDPSFTLVRARFDQAVRAGSLTTAEARQVERFVDRAETMAARDKRSAASTLRAQARNLRGPGEEALRAELVRLADAL